MQLILQVRTKMFLEMYHSFMKISHSKYQFMMRYLSSIFITFVIMGVLGGFIKQMVLLITAAFYFLFWYKHHLLYILVFTVSSKCIYGASRRT